MQPVSFAGFGRHKPIVNIWNSDVKFLTQKSDIVPVLLINFVTSMKTNQPFGRNTANPMPQNSPFSSQMLRLVRHPARVGAVTVQNVGMHVDTSAGIVFEHEIMLPTVGTIHDAQPVGGEQCHQSRHVLGGQSYVEIVMGPGLTAKQRIDRPTTINADVQPCRTCGLPEADDGCGVQCFSLSNIARGSFAPSLTPSIGNPGNPPKRRL